ncbi:MAG: serine hydrolase [Chitinophagaceae bacterium]
MLKSNNRLVVARFFLFFGILWLSDGLVAAQRPTFTPAPRKDSTLIVETADGTREITEKEIKDKEENEKNPAYKEKMEKARLEQEAAKGLLTSPAVKDLPGGTPSFITDSIDKYIERGMSLWNIPGLAIAIVKDGKVVFRKGYGVREVNQTDKVDENTLFIIASNTKLFTGTAMAKLENDKQISLNDKVTKYLPWFKLYDNNSTQLANIRDMLCHRIGLKTFQGDFTFWDSSLPKDSIIWKMRYLKPHGEFRQDYGYCNSAFLVAGRVLEKVTGKSWESYVQENILSPLGMNNTYMNTAGLVIRPNVAQPHNNLYGPITTLPFDKVDNLGPATSMVSNVKDLSKWLLFQLDSGRYEGKRILPWEVLQKTRDINITTNSRRSSYYPTHIRGYGLGVNTTDYNGRQIYWHTGGAFGHVTNVCFVPEEKLGITILSNNDNQSFFEALRYQILDAYLNVPYTDRSAFMYGFFASGMKVTADSVAALQARVDKKNKVPLRLDDYTGTFVNPVYGRITITKNEPYLLCRFEHHPELIGYMEYMDNHEFRMKYSNAGYGIFPTRFKLKNGRPDSVEVQVNDFLESDTYIFTKNIRAKPVK